MCYLGRSEKEEEITPLLLFLKKELKDDPISIAIDYSTAIDKAIKKVFPHTKIIRDGFHTVQLINKAILKELTVNSRKMYTFPINEIKQLYQQIKKDKFQGKCINLMPRNKFIKNFKYFYSLLVKLYKKNDLLGFIKDLNSVVFELRSFNTNYSHIFWNELINRLPSNGLTEKNLKYYRKKVNGAMSLVMRQFRRQLEREKKDFSKGKYLIVTRSENLTEIGAELLKSFLEKFPNYSRYRELSLRISNIYHLPPNLLTKSIITDIKLWKDAIPDLKAAVKTLNKNINKIFNFKYIFKEGTPDKYYRKIRTNNEYSMRKVKDVVRKRFGFRNKEMTRLYLENKLKCPVFLNPVIVPKIIY